MSIREKNLRNADLSNISQQDISLMGLVRRLSGVHISNITFLVPAAIMSLIPLLYKKNYTNKGFRFLFLAHVLMTMVLFSTSSESPTYIIAVTGAAIWFRALPGQRNAFEKGMVVFMLLLTSVAYTDVVPRTFRNEYIVRYSLKALPLSLIWMYNILHLIKYSINSNSIYAQEGRHRCAGI